jgi:endoglucanase
MTRLMFQSATVASAALLAMACGAVDPSESADENLARAESALTAAKAESASKFFIPPPDPGAVKQIAALLKARDFINAARVTAMVATPQAVWLAGGSATEVGAAVKKTMKQAALEKRVPVLVAYNLPFRDCAQYSAGGATDTAAYEAWIDGFAAGLGTAKAVVILEPDGLGIIPYNTRLDGVNEWCQPTVTAEDGSTVPAPGASPEARYEQLRYALAALKAKAPGAAVYLDSTHAGWLGVGDAAYRVNKASHDPITGAALGNRGFYLNASNFQTTAQSVQFGTWVSMCTAFATNAEEGGWRLGHFDWCPSQYNPATGYGLDYSPQYAASVTAQLQDLMGSAPASLPFVVDTGRNGKGALNAAGYAAAPYGQPAGVISALNNGGWCNPVGAGLGVRPTSTTNVPLVDAYLWIKTPGQSDGSCDIAGGARAWDYSQYNPWGLTSAEEQNHFDPLWGKVDPAAGAWFAAQALQLAQNATPPLF